MDARHHFTERTPCWSPSAEILADISAYRARVAAWEEMAEFASDFTTNRYALAKARFDALAQAATLYPDTEEALLRAQGGTPASSVQA